MRHDALIDLAPFHIQLACFDKVLAKCREHRAVLSKGHAFCEQQRAGRIEDRIICPIASRAVIIVSQIQPCNLQHFAGVFQIQSKIIFGVGHEQSIIENKVAQVNASTLITDYYLLTDPCHLTNGQGQVTLANAYVPYGILAQTAGSAQTSYGFTGEQTDPSGMVYLRARMYSPSDGRFLTRDTWGGDANSPMSYNKWQYVYSNPINLIDPTGQFPFWCRSMPSRLSYEDCVRKFYHLSAPRDYSVFPIQEGSPGCWAGPVAYRAPGYVEGFSVGFQSALGIGGGKELVYDFASMERQTFKFAYWGVADQVAISGTLYSGILFGFNNIETLSTAYQGDYWFVSGGVSTDFIGQPIQIGTGATYVSSIDNKIRGIEWYFSLGVSVVDPILIVDFEAGMGKSVDVQGASYSYVMANGRINQTLLLADIITGFHSPVPGFNPSGELGMRGIGVLLALQYSMIYEEIHVNSY